MADQMFSEYMDEDGRVRSNLLETLAKLKLYVDPYDTLTKAFTQFGAPSQVFMSPGQYKLYIDTFSCETSDGKDI